MVLYGRRAWATASQVVLLAVLIGQNLAQEDLKIGRQACGDMQCKGTKPVMNTADLVSILSKKIKLELQITLRE